MVQISASPVQALSSLPATHPSIIAALNYLDSQCDGAIADDGSGFNALDAAFGKSLVSRMEKGKSLTLKQQEKALKMLMKYQQTQLKNKLPTPEEFKDWWDKLTRLEVHPTSDPDVVEVLSFNPQRLEPARYEVCNLNGVLSCNCPRFPFLEGKNCKHIEKVEELECFEILSWSAWSLLSPKKEVTREFSADCESPVKGILIASNMAEMPTEANLITTANGFTLNAQQSSALLAMEKFIDSSERFFCLRGYAGTGKSTIIQELIYRLQERPKRLYIALSAPTNKAVKVLQAMADTWGLTNIQFSTIYQLLGMKLIYDDDGIENAVADSGNNDSLTSYDLIICDEASMLSEAIWKALSGRSRLPKMIFMGDPAQLPPVNERESKVFNSIENTVKLTQVMRFGSGIGKLVTEVRDNIEEVSVINPTDFVDESVIILDKFSWLDSLIESFQSEEYNLNPDAVRALAYTNKVVDWINAYVRRELFGLHSPQYQPGERLIATKPILQNKEILLTNSSECEVIEAVPDRLFDYKIWRIRANTEDNRRIRVICVDDSSVGDLEANLNRLKAEALECENHSYERKMKWREYFALRETFAPLKYAYALTVHKSQGSTFKNVYVTQSDILRNKKVKERNQLLYVAYSRASERLIISQD